MKFSRQSIERNLSNFANLVQETFFAEETARRKGWLQSVDPRVKMLGLFFLLICSSFSTRFSSILLIYAFALILAAGSGIFSVMFFRKVWLWVPLYTILIALPSLFIVPGDTIYQISDLFKITKQGLIAAGFLFLRVNASVSLMMLLVLTTRWSVLLSALRALFVPKILVLMLLMTYRYIYLLLHTAVNLFLARKSRRLGAEDWQSTRRWMEATLGVLAGKSIQTSQEVHLAMISRGFRGEPVILNRFSLRAIDSFWAALFVITGFAAAYLP